MAGFIYPIAYTTWVSNPVPVNKKQGTLRVCTNLRDLNHACPKDNFPTPFIDQLIDVCVGHEVLSFMDGFSGYNQIQIRKEDQYKTAFTTPLEPARRDHHDGHLVALFFLRHFLPIF